MEYSSSSYFFLHMFGNSQIPPDLGALRDTALRYDDEVTNLSKLPPKPSRSQEKWKTARNAVLEDQNNMAKWDDLFTLMEEKWNQLNGTDEPKGPFKKSVCSSYSQLLLRFPYLSEYWKRYLILQYKMNGLKDSIQVLEAATKEFPRSVSLWVDYLSALLSQDEDQEAKIRELFETAAKYIGLNFNADPFWDKYIEFETKSSSESTRVLELYLKLIKIPLYQYARYYNQFSVINKNFNVLQVIAEREVLQLYLDQFSKGLPEDLSVLEQHQIIDSYSYMIFSETQRKVNEKWEFESALTFQELSIVNFAEIGMQTEQWIKYLDHEIETLRAASEKDKQLQLDAVISLFERALVPNCYDGLLWLKYTRFLEEFSPEFENTKKVFDRAVFRFIPMDQPEVREEYVKFLTIHDKFDICNEYLLDSIRLYSGSSGTRVYAKNAYLHSISQILKFWFQQLPKVQVTSFLEGLISGYFDRIDRYKKDSGAIHPDGDKETAKFEAVTAFVIVFSKVLNDDGICLVVVQYLKLLRSTTETTTKIRKFYNKNHKEPALSRSVQFWKFYMEFESQQKNLVNLKRIIDHIKLASALPKIAVDAFIDMYYEFVCANLHAAIACKGEKIQDILLTVDIEKSESLVTNVSARKRLAANNSTIQELEEQRLQKANPNHYTPSSFNKEDELLKISRKHLGHPGIFVDTAPEITNSVLGKWISLADDDIEVPPLPIFKNVEKTNTPVIYPDE